MRTKLIEEVIKETLGPRAGNDEELDENPIDEYITGVIIPKKYVLGFQRRENEKKNIEPDSEIVASAGKCQDNEDDSLEEDLISYSPSTLDPRLRPQSFGLSFVTDNNEPSFGICITWGRYEQNDTNKKWKRRSNHKIFNVQLKDKLKLIEINETGGNLILRLQKREIEHERYMITIFLLNDLDIKSLNHKELAKGSIFQPEIRIILDEDTQLAEFIFEKESEMLFLHKARPVKARGHMCAAIWKSVDFLEILSNDKVWTDGEIFPESSSYAKPDIRSVFVPIYSISTPDMTWKKTENSNPVFSVHKLSEIVTDSEINSCLLPLINEYNNWIKENEKNYLNKDGFETGLVRNLIKKQKQAVVRMQKSINLLLNNEKIRLAFNFANKTIWLQKKWLNPKKNFSWRPFQLAFFLMNIESIADENSEYRDKMDLLWIPTGGGKTEAYLALMAFTMALRRLRSESYSKWRKSGSGTTIITRYTLRLLAVQQFRRTLRMVTAAEYLRTMKTPFGYGWRPKNYRKEKDFLYGSERFSIGMWVGGSLSPNHLRKNETAIAALLGRKARGEPAQIVNCPVCDTWLSIPNSGVSGDLSTFYFVVKKLDASVSINYLNSKIDVIKEQNTEIRKIEINKDNLKSQFFTLKIVLSSKKVISEKMIDELGKTISDLLEISICSFRFSRPGYFGFGTEPKRKKRNQMDFQVYCPNPDCDLNINVDYIEGVPMNINPENNEVLSDGNVRRVIEHPFDFNNRIPIPAYTVDEQIYSRCPTVIISTVDKIARLAFEPRTASIFGNINSYNCFYGYMRNGLYPAEGSSSSEEKQYNRDVLPLKPPELIIQDELHLITGPLGSIFGLYEIAVDALINLGGVKPKYISSSATIRHAENQCRLLFARELYQFPPNGIKISDSFFTRFHDLPTSWQNQIPGRVYVGIFAPGKGPLTPTIRLWSRLYKITNDFKEHETSVNFWTPVGYFNAIRELGGGRSLLREDIIERIDQITESSEKREIDQKSVVELSSRINSTDLPQLLKNLETVDKESILNNPDAIMTTSMFGTGVDIPHISLMIVNGQPKTTSQYIQATGRIGRTIGGLVVTFLRAGRPRDLSHYELFVSYHHRINLDVEPISVDPFSSGSLERASGPVLVSFLRNMINPSVSWYKNDGKVILDNNYRNDVIEFLDFLSKRLEKTQVEKENKEEVISYFDSQMNRWYNVAKGIHRNQDLAFLEYAFYNRPKKNVVLGSPEHEYEKNLRIVFKNAPQSLREIEETIGFFV